MYKEIFVRRYQSKDLESILQLFYDTVHQINQKDYSPQQLQAWAPKNHDKERWETLLQKNYVVIVEINQEIVGFGDLNSECYLEHLFVHKDFQRQKIASTIVEIIEQRAIRLDMETIYTESSITARPFFEKMGYEVLVEQNKLHNGQRFINYVMKKNL